MLTGERLTFATQGNQFSWHAEAARTVAGTPEIDILDFPDFEDVLTASLNEHPGLGVVAVNTAAGVVDRSARTLFANRTSAQAPLVKRVDLDIALSLIGSVEQSLEELRRPGVRCLLQDAARPQIDAFKRTHLPLLGYDRRQESTHAVAEMLAIGSPDVVAVGPSYSAALTGGFVLGPPTITPEGSVTSFYIFQRDPREKILPEVPTHTDVRTILGLSYPESPGEVEKCIDAAVATGLEITRYIPFRSGEETRHDPNIKKNGGFLEVRHKMYDSRVTKFCGKVNKLRGEDSVLGPFNAKRFGEILWLPEEIIDPETIALHDKYHQPDYDPATEK